METQQLEIAIEETTVVDTQKVSQAKRRRRAQRGMTLLEIMIVLAILALVMGLLVGPRVLRMFGEAKGETAKIAVTKLANEGYTQWTIHNPGKSCPQSIDELTKEVDFKSANDPWGNPYIMLCGDSLPPGARGIAIQSYGEDKKQGTPDDIKSWE